jgi:2-polyprenyl-6-methoxyphenol hydroxylase-like FAD-dependent oxidoreductase
MNGSGPGCKVLIIGAGPAGLALAQILRKRGIAYEVFERDDRTRMQGWSVGLDKCLQDLKEILPDDLPALVTASPNFELGKPDSFAFLNGHTKEVLGRVSADDGQGGRLFISTGRANLREILSSKLSISYGKRFQRFDQNSSGVTVYFADGSKAHGSVLIGADGGRSAVRSQLLPGFQAVPSRCVILHGNVDLTPEECRPVLDIANTALLIGEPGLKSYLQLQWYNKDGTSAWNWAVATLSKASESDARHAWAQSASGQELLDYALLATEHFPAYFQHALKKTRAEGIHTPPTTLMETVLPGDSLPEGLITLLGDAAHSMVYDTREWTCITVADE